MARLPMATIVVVMLAWVPASVTLHQTPLRTRMVNTHNTGRSQLRSRVARPPRLFVQQPILPQHNPAKTDAMLRLGHYSCALLGGVGTKMLPLAGHGLLASSCLVAGECLYGGRMLLTGSLTMVAAGGLWKSLNPRRWSRVLKPMARVSGRARATNLLADAGKHGTMLLYLPLESMRWLASVSPSPWLGLHGPSYLTVTHAVGALWLCWLAFQAAGLLVQHTRHRVTDGRPLGPSAARLLLDATLAINWIAPSLSLLQVGMVGTLSSALGLQEITARSEFGDRPVYAMYR